MSREAQRLDSGGGAGIGALSLDLLGQVLDRLREPRDRKACRLVSRAFARAEAAHRRALRALRREPLPRLLRAFPALERLDLSACASLDDASLAAAVAGVGVDLGIRRVCLARASGVGWRGLEALVAACPRLEAVDLSHCVGAGDREAAALAAAAGLRELRLDKCLGVTDMGLAKVAVGCPRLEKLSVKWCREISDIGLDLLAKKCRELRSLDISYLQVGNGSLKSISSFEKLEELAMVGCSCIDDEGLELLSKGSNSLQTVDVSRCDHVTSEGLASLIDGRKFLQKLHAADCLHEIGQCFLSKLATLKETLTVLKLDGLEVSASLLQAIGEGCENLVEIGLSKCSGVTDEGLSSLVARCTHLRTIAPGPHSSLLSHLTMVSKSPPSSGAAGSGDMRSAEKPLLPEHAGSPGGCSASVLGAVFNVSTSMVGAGIMSIPAPMRVLGVAPAVALIAAVAVLANAAVDFMLRYTRRAADGRRVRPRRGRAAQRVRRVQRLRDPHRLPHHHRGRDVRRGERRGCSRGGAAGVVRAAVVDQPGGDAGGGRGDSAASCAPEAYSLRYTSAISILLAVVFMLISLGIAVYALFRGTATMPRMLPDFSRLSSPLELFTAVPVIVVAFTFHFNVHPIRAELSKTSDMKAAVRISLVLCAAIYAAVGFFSFLLFGDATMADVLANFDRSSGPGVPQVLNDAARFSYALHLVLVFPLLLFSLQVNVDELLFPGRRPLATDARRFVSLTAVLMAVLYALAIAIPSIWTLFEFSGSTFAVTISLIFPGAIVLRDVHGKQSGRTKHWRR